MRGAGPGPDEPRTLPEDFLGPSEMFRGAGAGAGLTEGSCGRSCTTRSPWMVKTGL
jgi:hypothetical protein